MQTLSSKLFSLYNFAIVFIKLYDWVRAHNTLFEAFYFHPQWLQPLVQIIFIKVVRRIIKCQKIVCVCVGTHRLKTIMRFNSLLYYSALFLCFYPHQNALYIMQRSAGKRHGHEENKETTQQVFHGQ